MTKATKVGKRFEEKKAAHTLHHMVSEGFANFITKDDRLANYVM